MVTAESRPHVSRRARRHQSGFTLIELLVVIAILSVLAALVVLNVTGVKNTGQTAACKADVASVQTAVDEYLSSSGVPSGQLGAFAGTTTAAAITPAEEAVLAPYIDSNPKSCSSAGTDWGNIQVALGSNGDIVVSGTYG